MNNYEKLDCVEEFVCFSFRLWKYTEFTELFEFFSREKLVDQIINGGSSTFSGCRVFEGDRKGS